MLRDHAKPRSPLAILVENATDASAQAEPNWSMFMHICDLIERGHDESAKDGAKAIRKRLGCKVQENICLTLKLLETCVKNCGRLFHCHVATAKFMQELIKTINPKYHPTIGMQNHVLGLIQAWATAFRTVPELREFTKTYQDLKLKGVEFPPPDPEMALIGKQPPAKKAVVSPGMTGMAQTGQSAPPGAKLTNELMAVKQNYKVFSELLAETKPGQENADDLELLEDLNTTCRQMQQRIMELIESGKFEQNTEELLLVNDDLNNVFLRYERFQRMRSSQSRPSIPEPFQLEPTQPMPSGIYSDAASLDYRPQPPARRPNVQAAQQPDEYETLIDLSSETPPVSANQFPPPYPAAELADLSIYDNMPKVPTNSDPFVVPPIQPPLLNVSSGTSSNPVHSSGGVNLMERESVYAEMEQWLAAETAANSAGTSAVAQFDEFERFLSSRAQEVQQLPNVNSSEHQANTTAKTDVDQLFSL